MFPFALYRDSVPQLECSLMQCRASEAEVQSLNVKLGAALEHLFHHKLHIQQTLEQVQSHVEVVHRDIQLAVV